MPVDAANNIPTITTPIPRPPFVVPKSSPIECNSPAAIFVFSNIIPIKMNPNRRAVPASVKATGKPKSNNPNVVTNITIAKISGLIMIYYQTNDSLKVLVLI